jgi:hypothetical protein
MAERRERRASESVARTAWSEAKVEEEGALELPATPSLPGAAARRERGTPSERPDMTKVD